MITFERVRDAHEPCLNEFLLDTHHAYTLMVDHTLQESYDLVRIEELRIDMLRRLDVWRTMEDPVYYKNSEAIHDVWSSLALDIEMYVDSIPDETI